MTRYALTVGVALALVAMPLLESVNCHRCSVVNPCLRRLRFL